MKKIYKYTLAVADTQKITVPMLDDSTGFKDQVLMVDTQKGRPFLWCMVDDKLPVRDIVIHTVGTGHPIPDVSKKYHIGSYMISDGSLVFHVFLGT